MTNPMNLSGKRILVAGASGCIGRSCAQQAASLGAQVLLQGRDAVRLAQTMESMGGEGHRVYPFDLLDVEGIEEWVESIVSECGKLDGLIYSTGILEERPLAMLKPAVMRQIMTVNFFGFCELVRVYAKKRNNNGGAIAAISSIAAERGDKSRTAYCASKAAINGAVRSMAKELGTKNIRVNAVMPGMVDSDMMDSYVKNSGHEVLNENLLTYQYLGLGQPKDVANMACYLLSDAAKFITGTAVAVDGGYLS